MDFPLANTYGIRSDLFLQSADDYHRHRHRTNKKLNKLRRDLNIITKDTKNYSEKNKISSIESGNYDMDTKFGDVLLYQIERDLLYAQETRLLLDVHTSKSKEKFLISKYKKALKTGKQLLATISNEQDDLKVLEILTYISIIEGYLSISKKKFNLAIYSFSIARCNLNYLYNYSKLPIQFTNELYYNIIDLVVDPALQVSLIQLNSKRISDLNELAKETIFNDNKLIPYLHKSVEIILKENPTYVTPSNQNEIQLLKEINWGSYNASIKSDDLSVSIMKINDELKGLDYTNYLSYDSVLNLYQDSINLQNQEIERNGNDEEDEDYQEQFIILTYLKYNYLLLTIKRDYQILISEDNLRSSNKQKLFESWKKCFKLNDSILSTLTEIKDLPGIGNDDDILNFLNSIEIYFTIQNYLRLSNAHLIYNNYINSLSLIARSSRLIKTVKPFNEEDNLPTLNDLNNLKEKLNVEKSKLYILSNYFNENSNTTSNVGSDFIIDNISKFPKFQSQKLLENVVPLKIDFQPVSVKPVLFDIAYNYINYDDIENDNEYQEEVLQSKNVENDAAGSKSSDSDKKKGGFFGLFGR